MPSELQAYIDELIGATKSGSIEWKEVNPTTFLWETGPPKKARLSLQRVEKTVKRITGGKIITDKTTSYIFQAFEVRANVWTTRFTMNSADEPELRDQFEALFQLVKMGISQKNVEFLKSLLPGENK